MLFFIKLKHSKNENKTSIDLAELKRSAWIIEKSRLDNENINTEYQTIPLGM